jgi:hypothetical protein
MAKIMGVMVILLRDTAAKACSSFNCRARPWWRLAAIFFQEDDFISTREHCLKTLKNGF